MELDSLLPSRRHILLAALFLLGTARCVLNGANDLHFYDGTGPGDFIASDLFFEIIDPQEIAYTFKVKPTREFGTLFNESMHMMRLVPVEPPCGCGAARNSEELQGAIALAERGECSFVSKAVRAQQAGAKALLVSDRDHSDDHNFVEMIHDNTNRPVHVPVAFMVGKNGYMIRMTLERLGLPHALINIPVNVSHLSLYQLNQPPWQVW